MLEDRKEKITIVGAGLVGSLLAIYLARRGFRVQIFERREDPRTLTETEGKSINLAISARGIHALNKLEIAKDILSQAIPMKGRLMHSVAGELTYQPYGKDESMHINSISRSGLNNDLLHVAQRDHDVELHFCQKLTHADLKNRVLTFLDERSEKEYRVQTNLIFGTDGAASIIRNEMKEEGEFREEIIDSGAAYKELTILGKEGQHRMEKNALHIWPRGKFMLIALPNMDGSFTCTLFCPKAGENSFERLETKDNVRTFFQEHFPDALVLIDRLEESFFESPTGSLKTVRCYPWTSRPKTTLLLGDAAHAVIPFFGQGMNCGFEDCVTLDDIMEEMGSLQHMPWGSIFSRFEKDRKPKADAISKMSIENFDEMRDHVADPRFLLEKEVEKILERDFGKKYVSRYSMVSFSRMPYDYAYAIGQTQKEILQDLCKNITNPEEIDLDHAEKLLQERLEPELKKYRELVR